MNSDQTVPWRVALCALLVPVILSLATLAIWPNRFGRPGEIAMSDARLRSTLVIEVFFTVTLGAWLWRWGWRPHRTTTLPFARRDLLRALGVWLMALVGIWGWTLLCRLVAPEFTTRALHTQIVGRPSFTLIVMLSAGNAVFEEFLWLGLGVAALGRFGAGVAGATSVCLRTLVHVYQGPLALTAILPFGVVFTAYYLRTRRLWPVVLAHGLQDVLALSLAAAGLASRSGG